MDFHVLPSVMALLVKVWLCINVRKTFQRENITLASFLVSLFFLNLIELTSFHYISSDLSVQRIVLNLYYVSLIFTIATFFCLSVFLSYASRLNRPILVLALATLISIAVCFTDLIISGVKPIAYSGTRIPGQYYWIIQLYVVCALIASAILLIAGVLNLEERLARVRCGIVLAAFLPTILSIIAVAALMEMGLEINATMWVSSGTTLFLLVIIYTEDRFDLFKLLEKIPFTEENKKSKAHYNSLRKLFFNSQYGSKVDLRELLQNIEDAILENALASGATQEEAAKKLGLPKTTFSRKIKHIRQ